MTCCRKTCFLTCSSEDTELPRSESLGRTGLVAAPSSEDICRVKAWINLVNRVTDKQNLTSRCEFGFVLSKNTLL